jgi:sugar transferase (PEP-CTERM/EpsH1 system associated)
MSAMPPLIVHVVYRLAIGGLENGVVNLINRLPVQSWRHTVVSLTDVDPDFAARISRSNVRCIPLHKAPGHGVRLYPRLVALLRELKPAIVHTRNLAALEAALPAWIAGVPARLHGEHGRDVGDLDGSSVRYQIVRRLFRPFVTRYVALSPDLERYLRDRVGVPADKIDQIYNGVDIARFCPAVGGRGAIDACPFQGAGYWLVGTVGRMEAVKDQTNLARAFVAALNAHPEARARLRLVLVGDGKLKGEVAAILESAGVRELAWFAGERADVVPLLQGLDCFVLPSLAEGVSNTVLEAMACGLPVVATRVGANAELVEENVTGRTVPAGDSEALAREIGAYFAAPELAREHGQAARRRVERRFSLERMVEDYDRVYAGLLRTRAAERAGTAAASARPRARG